MSIQSEITRISSSVSTQSSLIKQISEALEGKTAGGGSGGGSVETCAVIIRLIDMAPYPYGYYISYTSYENNKFATKSSLDAFASNESMTRRIEISNVVCGSSISVAYDVNQIPNGGYNSVEIAGTGRLYAYSDFSQTFSAPTVNGEVCTINISPLG